MDNAKALLRTIEELTIDLAQSKVDKNIAIKQLEEATQELNLVKQELEELKNGLQNGEQTSEVQSN